ncbi:MAG: kynureninase [Haloglomus sp.]
MDVPAATRESARARDEHGLAAEFGDRFDAPGIYLDGNSLGPVSTDAERALDRAVDQWRELAIDGWTDADPEWFTYGERLGDRLAPLVGAELEEVVAANATTVNIHTLVGTFYDRADGGTVLVNELDFPTDHYAIRAQLRQRGLDPDDHLTVVESRDGRTIEEADVERALAEEDVALLFMPSVLYRSGQLLDVERLTDAAHDHGAYAGFDLAHSVGVVPHDLHDAGVDFATWCHYKYCNAGPGAIAGLYCHADHFGVTPALAGWWGHEKATQFEMNMTYTPARSAGAFQIGTVPILSAAPLDGALDVIEEAGIDRIREESLALTAYLARLVEDLDGYAVGTPRDPNRRGGHVAVEHPAAARVTQALRDRGVVVDYRPPNVVRMAPAPLYVSFEDVFDAVAHLAEIHSSGAYETYEPPGDVT